MSINMQPIGLHVDPLSSLGIWQHLNCTKTDLLNPSVNPTFNTNLSNFTLELYTKVPRDQVRAVDCKLANEGLSQDPSYPGT